MKQTETLGTRIETGLPAVIVWGIAPLVALAIRLDAALWYAVIASLVAFLTTAYTHLIRRWASPNWLVVHVLICAAFFVGLAELLLESFAPGMRHAMGIYLPLLAVSPLVLVNVEFASAELGLGAKFGKLGAILARFALMLLAFAAIRELLGAGSLTIYAQDLKRVQLLVPGLSEAPVAYLLSASAGLLLAGFALAARNVLKARKAEAQSPKEAA